VVELHIAGATALWAATIGLRLSLTTPSRTAATAAEPVAVPTIPQAALSPQAAAVEYAGPPDLR